MNNKNILFNALLAIINYLNSINPLQNKKLIITTNYNDAEFNYDDNIFFNLGQLFAILYIFNVGKSIDGSI